MTIYCLWIKPTDAPNSNFIGITTLHVSGSLSAHHQEFLAVHRIWYILCSFDERMLPGVGTPGSIRSSPILINTNKIGIRCICWFYSQGISYDARSYDHKMTIYIWQLPSELILSTYVFWYCHKNQYSWTNWGIAWKELSEGSRISYSLVKPEQVEQRTWRAGPYSTFTGRGFTVQLYAQWWYLNWNAGTTATPWNCRRRLNSFHFTETVVRLEA